MFLSVMLKYWSHNYLSYSANQFKVTMAPTSAAMEYALKQGTAHTHICTCGLLV